MRSASTRFGSSDAPAIGLTFRRRGAAAGWLIYVLPLLLIGILVVAAILNGLAYVRNFVDSGLM